MREQVLPATGEQKRKGLVGIKGGLSFHRPYGGYGNTVGNERTGLDAYKVYLL